MLPFGTEAEARAQPQAGDLVEHHLGAQARAADIGHVRRGETIAAAIDAQLLRGLCIEDRHAPADLGVKTARSEEHTSELQSLMRISYAVFCLKKKKQST